MMSLSITEIIKTYLKGLETADATGITRLFAEDGEVHSPLYGKMKASTFYQKLFGDTQQSDIHLLHILQDIHKPDVAAAHFRYEWKMSDGKSSSFECVDVFYFDKAQKIKEMHIIYDTQHTLDAFNSLR